MRMKTIISILCAGLALSACKRSEGTETGGASPGAEPAPPPAGEPAATTGHSLSHALQDSARASFGRDTAAAGRVLRAAAAHARQEADQANQATRTALNRSAAELDSLATAIAGGVQHTQARVDSAFARLKVAEGLRDLASAVDAWAAEQRVRAGEELEAAAASLEDAARDTQSRLDAEAEQAAADARAVADRARRNAEVSAEEFRRVSAELEAQLQRFAERIRTR